MEQEGKLIFPDELLKREIREVEENILPSKLRAQEEERLILKEAFLIKNMDSENFAEAAGEIIMVLKKYGLMDSPACMVELLEYLSELVKNQYERFMR